MTPTDTPLFLREPEPARDGFLFSVENVPETALKTYRFGGVSAAYTDWQLSKMQYLEACLREAMQVMRPLIQAAMIRGHFAYCPQARGATHPCACGMEQVRQQLLDFNLRVAKVLP